jgi:hypothetical protein
MMANKDIERALMEALGMGQRPRMRPKGMGGSGRTMSDADKLKMMMRESEGVGEADTKISPEQMKLLELMMQQQQMEQGAAERKAFPPASMMNRGGEVQGYKPGGAVRKKKNKKSKMGCVMPGRGGKYKGIK